MSDKFKVMTALRSTDFPLSDYGIYHTAKSLGLKMTPSSARTRRRELERLGLVKAVGTELSPTGYKARTFAPTI